MRIVEIQSPREFAAAANLMREFLAWTRERFSQLPEVVDAYYDMGAWERELTGLDSEYRRPDGALLLATDSESALGCVGLRRFDDDICEMKRLFVSPRAQGAGAGRALCSALTDVGRELGFRHMRLETGDLQTEAHALYRSLGFRDIPPYRAHPQMLLDHMICMELDLR